MDEGTKAIIRDISRDLVDSQWNKWEELSQKNNEYFDKKFACIELKINEIKEVVDDMKIKGCKQCIDHVLSHKEKEKKMVRMITLISVAIPSVVLLGNWIKGMVVIWWKSGTKGT